MGLTVLSWVTVVVGAVLALLIALRAGRPEWFNAAASPSGRVRVIMLVVALFVGIATVAVHGELVRRGECVIATDIHREGAKSELQYREYAWRRAAADRGYLLTIESVAVRDEPVPQEYRLWHGDHLVAVWSGGSGPTTTCGEQD